jgi:5-methylcytosine-specific restriction protein A
VHVRKPWQHLVPVQRLRGRALQTMRRQVWAAAPVCKACRTPLAFADEWALDHRVAISRGGTDDRSNLQILCGRCHQRKSRGEARRG